MVRVDQAKHTQASNVPPVRTAPAIFMSFSLFICSGTAAVEGQRRDGGGMGKVFQL